MIKEIQNRIRLEPIGLRFDVMYIYIDGLYSGLLTYYRKDGEYRFTDGGDISSFYSSEEVFKYVVEKHDNSLLKAA